MNPWKEDSHISRISVFIDESPEVEGDVQNLQRHFQFLQLFLYGRPFRSSRSCYLSFQFSGNFFFIVMLLFWREIILISDQKWCDRVYLLLSDSVISFQNNWDQSFITLHCIWVFIMKSLLGFSKFFMKAINIWSGSTETSVAMH